MGFRQTLLLLVALLVPACDSGTEPIDQSRVEITPREADMMVGDTTWYEATLYDPDGVVTSEGVLHWGRGAGNLYAMVPEYPSYDAARSRRALIWAAAPGDVWLTVDGPGGVRDSVHLSVQGHDVSFESIAVGLFGCGLTAAGQPYCWGGQTVRARRAWVLQSYASPRPIEGGPAFELLHSGAQFACGLDAGGAAYCWGHDRDNGTLGSGAVSEPVTQPQPVVGGLQFDTLAVGGLHTCGLTPDGQAYCWGADRYGQLGVGDPVEHCLGTRLCSTSPAPVAGDLRFRTLSPGGYHTCGIATDGETYCWGLNLDYQLGTESAPDLCPDSVTEAAPCSRTPLQMEGAPAFETLAAGGMLTCGLTSEGSAYCWGNNMIGSLGAGTDLEYSATPLPVAGDHVFTSLAGTCAVAASGQAYCWGDNRMGQNGTEDSETCTYFGGAAECHRSPVPVSGSILFESLEIGAAYVCGMAQDGIPYCWGTNAYGSLGSGDRSYSRSSSPVPVYGTH